MNAEQLRDSIASTELELALLKRELKEHQSFKIVSSCHGQVLVYKTMDYDSAYSIELKQLQIAQDLEDSDQDKAERECVTAVPYKWLDTDELVFPDAWQEHTSHLHYLPTTSFDFSKSTVEPVFMVFR